MIRSSFPGLHQAVLADKFSVRVSADVDRPALDSPSLL